MGLKVARARADFISNESERELFWKHVHKENAMRLWRLIRRLRGSFYFLILILLGWWVKVGQFLSSRPDVLPPEYIQELSKLQDAMPTSTPEVVRKIVEGELGCKLEDVFSSFEETALASASIAQVHRATLKDGRLVVVKVQHPDVETLLEQDMHTLIQICRLYSRVESGMSFEVVLREWQKEAGKELDFRNEMANQLRARNAMTRGKIDIVVPEVFPHLTYKRILVMEYIDGFKITDTEKLEKYKVDRNDLMCRICDAFAYQVHVDGMFHGDPHAGNILVQIDEAGRAWPVLLDWGLVKAYSRKEQYGIAKLVHSISALDMNGLLEAFEEIGFEFKEGKRDQLDPEFLMEAVKYAMSDGSSAGTNEEEKKDTQSTSKINNMQSEVTGDSKTNNVKKGEGDYSNMSSNANSSQATSNLSHSNGNNNKESNSTNNSNITNNLNQNSNLKKLNQQPVAPTTQLPSLNPASTSQTQPSSNSSASTTTNNNASGKSTYETGKSKMATAAKDTSYREKHNPLQSWPESIILLLRTMALLYGLTKQLSVDVPFMKSLVFRAGQVLRRRLVPFDLTDSKLNRIYAERLLRVSPPLYRGHLSKLEGSLANFLHSLHASNCFVDSGMQVAVMRKGQLLASASVGQRGPIDLRPVNEKTLFSVGGISHLLQAITVLALVDSGKSTLDTPVKKIWPSFQPVFHDSNATPPISIHINSHQLSKNNEEEYSKQQQQRNPGSSPSSVSLRHMSSASLSPCRSLSNDQDKKKDNNNNTNSYSDESSNSCDITLRHLLSHTAGLHEALLSDFRLPVLLDFDGAIQYINQAPIVSKPGELCRYHFITMGWLWNEIVSRLCYDSGVSKHVTGSGSNNTPEDAKSNVTQAGVVASSSAFSFPSRLPDAPPFRPLYDGTGELSVPPPPSVAAAEETVRALRLKFNMDALFTHLIAQPLGLSLDVAFSLPATEQAAKKVYDHSLENAEMSQKHLKAHPLYHAVQSASYALPSHQQQQSSSNSHVSPPAPPSTSSQSILSPPPPLPPRCPVPRLPPPDSTNTSVRDVASSVSLSPAGSFAETQLHEQLSNLASSRRPIDVAEVRKKDLEHHLTNMRAAAQRKERRAAALGVSMDDFDESLTKRQGTYTSALSLLKSKPHLLDPCMNDCRRIFTRPRMPTGARCNATGLVKLAHAVQQGRIFSRDLFKQMIQPVGHDNSLDAVVLLGGYPALFGLGCQLFECDLIGKTNGRLESLQKSTLDGPVDALGVVAGAADFLLLGETGNTFRREAVCRKDSESECSEDETDGQQEINFGNLEDTGIASKVRKAERRAAIAAELAGKEGEEVEFDDTKRRFQQLISRRSTTPSSSFVSSSLNFFSRAMKKFLFVDDSPLTANRRPSLVSSSAASSARNAAAQPSTANSPVQPAKRTLAWGHSDVSGSVLLCVPEEDIIVSVLVSDVANGPAATKRVLEWLLPKLGVKPFWSVLQDLNMTGGDFISGALAASGAYEYGSTVRETRRRHAAAVRGIHHESFQSPNIHLQKLNDSPSGRNLQPSHFPASAMTEGGRIFNKHAGGLISVGNGGFESHNGGLGVGEVISRREAARALRMGLTLDTAALVSNKID